MSWEAQRADHQTKIVLLAMTTVHYNLSILLTDPSRSLWSSSRSTDSTLTLVRVLVLIALDVRIMDKGRICSSLVPLAAGPPVMTTVLPYCGSCIPSAWPRLCRSSALSPEARPLESVVALLSRLCVKIGPSVGIVAEMMIMLSSKEAASKYRTASSDI